MTFSPLALQPFSATSSSRLQSLYADISRQKHSNPVAFQANVDWWRRALYSIIAEGNSNKLVINIDRDFIDSLRLSAIGKPLALRTVVTILPISLQIESKKELQLPDSTSQSQIPRLINLGEFLNAAQSLFYAGSLPLRIVSFVVGKPFWWALSQLGITEQDSSHSNSRGNNEDWLGQYVLFELLDNAANAVKELQVTEPDVLYDWASFQRTFASAVSKNAGESMSETDAKVLVRHLERDRQVLVADGDVIKFVGSDANSREITSVDRGVVELRVAVAKLQNQVEGIQSKIDGTTAKASTALRASHKALALAHLRSRKSLEEVLRRRLQSLETLQGTLSSVENARGDVEILALHASSTSTLRALLAHPSLQRDAIDATMDALAEANMAAKEVDDSVRTGGDVALDIQIEEDELQDELNKLVREAEMEKLQAKLDHAGQVPDGVGANAKTPETAEREAVHA